VTLTDVPDPATFVFDPSRFSRARTVLPDGPAAGVGQAVELDDGAGHRYLASLTPGSAEPRWAVAVVERKVPYAERPTRGLLDTPEQEAERGYLAVFPPADEDDPTSQLGAADAPDDDPVHGVGVISWWRGVFTEAEVETLRAAPSTIAVTYETRYEPYPHTIVRSGAVG
jgi:hypothetical protein